jgi:medium-chain acyl-[acyl-carrier-protein] hydrolase
MSPHPTNTASWIQRYAPRPECAVRVFCFHHAGAGAASYRPWALAMPDFVEVCALQLPGHGHRWAERPLDDMPSIVSEAVAAMVPVLDKPYAMFGHSMGATVGAEVAAALARGAWPLPFHLFVSGRRPPHVDDGRSPIGHLDQDTFLQEISRRYAPIPREILAEPSLLELLLPALRADIRALESYRPQLPDAPLPIPVTAMGGEADESAPARHLDAWREFTSASFRRLSYPGGHFYVEERRHAIIADVVATIRAFLAARNAAA